MPGPSIMDFHRWRRDNPGGNRDQWIAETGGSGGTQTVAPPATPDTNNTITIAGKEYPINQRYPSGDGGSFSSYSSRSSLDRPGSGSAGFNKLIEQITSNPGALADLDEETLANLEAIKQAQFSQAEEVYTDEKNALLRDLFGRSVERSTVAGEAGGRLLSRRAGVLAGIEGQAGERNIALRQNIRDARLQALLGGGQLLNERFDSNVRLRVGMAQVDAENARTNAQLKIAAIEDATNRALGFAGLGLKEQLGMRELDIMQQRADTEASMSSFNKKKSILGMIGTGIGSIIGLFSHSSLKENIENFNKERALKLVKDLNVVRYNYREGTGLGSERRHVGVMADQSPEEISTGHFIVEGDTIFTLVAAVQALAEKVEELENAR